MFILKKMKQAILILTVLGFSCTGTDSSRQEVSGGIRPLADDYVVLQESSDPDSIYLGTPGLALIDKNRIIATMDFFGPGVKNMPGIKGIRKGYYTHTKGRIKTSDDHGKTWTERGDYPMTHARPFKAGNSVYILGHSGDVKIIKSDDNGETWSGVNNLSEGENWTGAADNVVYSGDKVYLALEKRLERGVKDWQVANIAPVLMRANVNEDLTKRENWTFASDLVFEDVVNFKELDYFGVPFFKSHPKESTWPAPGRAMSSPGWLETNVVQFHDPDHLWHDPAGKTFHLWMRAHTGGTGFAAIAKAVENEDGTITTKLETVPSGKKIVYVPCPGGQMKFHIVYDEKTKLYWLAGTQSTDSMTRIDRLPDDRYNLPNNERRRLQLCFSKNMIDWCFAGIIAIGPEEKASRHYVSMIIDGEDLQVLSRSGDKNALNPHNGNIITFHTVKNFRSLVY